MEDTRRIGKYNNKKKRKKKKMKTTNKVLLIILSVILAILVMGTGYVLGTFNKIKTDDLNTENLAIDEEEISQYENADKITNIALFGLDSGDGTTGRSDSIMVATVDPVHKKLKITSIMRDSYVNIEGYGNDKINHAYAYGGPELAIRTINDNFGLNIEDYVTVSFSSLPVIIDKLGGIELDITNDEIQYINDYINSLNAELGRSSANIYTSGVQHVDGVQALAYSRIRYTAGGDYERTQRHRTVLGSLFSKLTSMSVTQYPGLLNELLPYVETSLNSGEILSLGTKVLSIGNNLEQDRFPRDGYGYGETIDGVYYLTFDRETIKEQMREYIFNDVK